MSSVDDLRSDFCVSEQFVPGGDLRQYAWGAEWGRITSGPVNDPSRWRDVFHAYHVKHVYRRRSRTSLLCESVGLLQEFLPRYEYCAVMMVYGSNSGVPVPFLMTADNAGYAVDKAVASFLPLQNTQTRGNLELLASAIADDQHLAWMYARIKRHIDFHYDDRDPAWQSLNPRPVYESDDLLFVKAD